MAKKKHGYRTPQVHTSLRAGETPGTYEVTLALRGLQAPEREFYCTNAQAKRRSNYVTFIFGQFSPGTSILKNIVGVDVPYRSLAPIAGTFDESFRGQLRNMTQALAPLESGGPTARDVETVSLFAHVARIVISDIAGVIDFYEMEPALGSVRPVHPVIRIKSMPAVVTWFVDIVDSLVKELGAQSSVEVVDEKKEQQS